jgi:hypothetical protein
MVRGGKGGLGRSYLWFGAEFFLLLSQKTSRYFRFDIWYEIIKKSWYEITKNVDVITNVGGKRS